MESEECAATTTAHVQCRYNIVIIKRRFIHRMIVVLLIINFNYCVYNSIVSYMHYFHRHYPRAKNSDSLPDALAHSQTWLDEGKVGA